MVSLYGLGALAGGLDQGMQEADQRRMNALRMLAMRRQMAQQMAESQAIGSGIQLPGLGGPQQPPPQGPPGPLQPGGSMAGVGPAIRGSLAGFPGSQPPPAMPQAPQFGGAPQAMPAGAAPPPPPAQAQPDQASFDTIDTDWMQPQEGGLNRNDGGGSIANFGINSRANPGVDVRKLTAEQAKALRQQRYWGPSGAGKLPPGLAAVQYDTAMLMGPRVANQMLKASGGDPAAYLKLREQAFRKIAAANPAKAKDLPAWLRRNAKLGQYAAGLKDAGAEQPQAPAGGGPQQPAAAGPEGDNHLMDMWAQMQQQTSPEAVSRTLGQITSALKEKFPHASDEQLGWMTEAYLGELTKVAGLYRQPDAANMLLMREMEQDRRYDEGQAGQDRRQDVREAHQDARADQAQAGQDRRQDERLKAQQRMLDQRLAQSQRIFEQRERDIDARLAKRGQMSADTARVRATVASIKADRQAVVDKMNAFKAQNAGVVPANDPTWAKLTADLDTVDQAMETAQRSVAAGQSPAAAAPPKKTLRYDPKTGQLE